MNLTNYIKTAIRNLRKLQLLLSAKSSLLASHYSVEDQRISEEFVVRNIDVLNFINNILLDARKKAFDEICGLKKLKSAEKNILSTIRILRLQAYLASSWSIYDQICNMVFRICGHPHATNQNISFISPTIFSFFNPSKNNYIGRVVPSLLYKHGKPVQLSYIMRSIYLHEGGGLHDLFRSTAINENALALDNEKFLNLAEKGECKATMKNPDGWPWDEDDVIHLDNFLSQAHQHADRAHGILLSWAIESFSKEIDLVLRD